MLTSDLTRKLKGAHNIPIPTPLITAFLPFLWKGPPFFPLPVFLHPPSLFAPATKVTFLFNRECKSTNIQIPSWSSPLPSSHPDSAGVDPKLIQFYNTTWRSAEWSTFSLSVSSDVSQESTGILSISFLEQVDELEAFTALVLLRKGILKLVKSWLRVLYSYYHKCVI